MTSQERAYEVARKWMPGSEPDSMRVIALMCHIQLAIDAAVAECEARVRKDEREECAKVAESKAGNIRGHAMYPAYGMNSQAHALDDIAEAIRTRGAQ